MTTELTNEQRQVYMNLLEHLESEKLGDIQMEYWIDHKDAEVIKQAEKDVDTINEIRKYLNGKREPEKSFLVLLEREYGKLKKLTMRSKNSATIQNILSTKLSVKHLIRDIEEDMEETK